jgi:hypothetical protein
MANEVEQNLIAILKETLDKRVKERDAYGRTAPQYPALNQAVKLAREEYDRLAMREYNRVAKQKSRAKLAEEAAKAQPEPEPKDAHTIWFESLSPTDRREWLLVHPDILQKVWPSQIDRLKQQIVAEGNSPSDEFLFATLMEYCGFNDEVEVKSILSGEYESQQATEKIESEFVKRYTHNRFVTWANSIPAANCQTGYEDSDWTAADTRAQSIKVPEKFLTGEVDFVTEALDQHWIRLYELQGHDITHLLEPVRAGWRWVYIREPNGYSAYRQQPELSNPIYQQCTGFKRDAHGNEVTAPSNAQSKAHEENKTLSAEVQTEISLTPLERHLRSTPKPDGVPSSWWKT